MEGKTEDRPRQGTEPGAPCTVRGPATPTVLSAQQTWLPAASLFTPVSSADTVISHGCVKSRRGVLLLLGGRLSEHKYHVKVPVPGGDFWLTNIPSWLSVCPCGPRVSQAGVVPVILKPSGTGLNSLSLAILSRGPVFLSL